MKKLEIAADEGKWTWVPEVCLLVVAYPLLGVNVHGGVDSILLGKIWQGVAILVVTLLSSYVLYLVYRVPEDGGDEFREAGSWEEDEGI